LAKPVKMPVAFSGLPCKKPGVYSAGFNYLYIV